MTIYVNDLATDGWSAPGWCFYPWSARRLMSLTTRGKLNYEQNLPSFVLAAVVRRRLVPVRAKPARRQNRRAFRYPQSFLGRCHGDGFD